MDWMLPLHDLQRHTYIYYKYIYVYFFFFPTYTETKCVFWTFVKNTFKKTLGIFVSSLCWMPYSSLLAGLVDDWQSYSKFLDVQCAECNGFYRFFFFQRISPRYFLNDYLRWCPFYLWRSFLLLRYRMIWR